MVSDTGAIDNEFEDAEKSMREQLTDVLESYQMEPVEGGLAFDLVTRQPLFVRQQVAESIVKFHKEAEDARVEEFNLASYKGHPWLPVTVDDAVYECAFIPRNVEQVHKISDTYDYPRGRLMTIPIHRAWQEE